MAQKLFGQTFRLLLLWSLLFLPAGTLAWPQAWIFLALFAGCGFAIGVWLLKTNPDLLAERMKSPISRDQAARDRAVIIAMVLCFFAWFMLMGLDARRFGWSHTPTWAQVLGACLIIVAFCGWAQVLRTNHFASVMIRLQKERAQTVISSGPYAVVRHPMYSYALLLFIGAPLLLGSLWGLLGLVVFLPLLALRIFGEEAMLMDGLPGYRDYASKVRFRLLPGVW
ncbi:methyltransferase family protein [Dyella humicola]|uniref:methyltransferase family protein n=1 Tax=Dyella humicola TaxID=2992126 RepID=UPI0022535436|nr:isoprenylcysteine carboxylmethyltransferase family protein [Dyella humicola]